MTHAHKKIDEASNPADKCNLLHVGSDVDSAADSHHHSLGIGTSQAAVGSHKHSGRDSYKVGSSDVHGTDDVDASAVAHHHTLGVGANQATSGTHTHDGTNTPRVLSASVHNSDDVDTAVTSHHHTQGLGAFQANQGTHTHDGTNALKVLSVNVHNTDDVDAAAASHHHSIGATALQAAAGNHTHTGLHTITSVFTQAVVDTAALGAATTWLTIAGVVCDGIKKVKVSFNIHSWVGTVLADVFNVVLQDNATQIGGVQVKGYAVGTNNGISFSMVYTPTNASHSFTLVVGGRSVGTGLFTGKASSISPAQLTVEEFS